MGQLLFLRQSFAIWTPFLFNRIAEAINWIVCNRTNNILHYLDDYLITGPANSKVCASSLDTMLTTCQALGVPIAQNKLEGPTLTFLGIEMDTVNRVLRLPQDKLNDITSSSEKWSTTTTCMKQELLSLIGTLSFACKCIPAGRIFLQRMIDLSTTASALHQRITLSTSFQLDLEWWKDFLPTWNGTASFLDSTWTPVPEMELYTDASSTIRCGGYFNGEWFSLQWSAILSNNDHQHSIVWKELLPILLSCLIWGHLWHGRRVMFHCDNESIVHTWRKGSTRCPYIMQLIRAIFLTAASSNFHVMITHIRGTDNNIADALSRLQMNQFHSLAPHATTKQIIDYLRGRHLLT
uniref:Uncharacterized protein LOC100377439 n=1 Tax=Saccoglossus kowalevskii TaxID=10224 RepID=A0ABM0MRH7_SACKO|nr:PREDICTED: uncharacterized protein LOC100377439 [Saccoglossus kowalevskii]